MIIFLIFVTLLLVQVGAQHLLKPRITNGEDAYPNQFPFMASIQLTSLPFLSYFHVCCGIIYNEYWILSTAVCVKTISMTKRARVVIGMHFTSKKDKNVQIIKIAEKIAHENFSLAKNYWSNDIGLIKLQTAISNPVPAEIAQAGSNPTGEAFIIGWGRTSKGFFGKIPVRLQYGRTLILQNKKCQLIFVRAQVNFIIQDSQICTHSPTKYVSGSKGDAGGPVVYNVNGKPVIAGLLSINMYPHRKGSAATVNTRVSYFTDWINKNIQDTLYDASYSNNSSTPLLVAQ